MLPQFIAVLNHSLDNYETIQELQIDLCSIGKIILHPFEKNKEELKKYMTGATVIFQCSYPFSHNHGYIKEDQYISKAIL